MATTTITYNGSSLYSGDQTDPVAVTYNGNTIVSIAAGESKTLNCSGKYMNTHVGVGTKTLTCAGQIMAGDVQIAVAGGGLPGKGQLITMDLGNATPAAGTQNLYRVLSVNGDIAFVVAMFDQWTDTYFSYDDTNVYPGGELDETLNTTWYNSLNSTAKSAIQATTITQYQYKHRSTAFDADTHASYADYSTKAVKAAVGSRYVYALDVEDIETYFGGTFSTADIWTLFYNTTVKPSRHTYPWLRSSDDATVTGFRAWWVNGKTGRLDAAYTDSSYGGGYGPARPAFKIDLTQIAWSYAT